MLLLPAGAAGCPLPTPSDAPSWVSKTGACGSAVAAGQMILLLLMAAQTPVLRHARLQRPHARHACHKRGSQQQPVMTCVHRGRVGRGADGVRARERLRLRLEL